MEELRATLAALRAMHAEGLLDAAELAQLKGKAMHQLGDTHQRALCVALEHGRLVPSAGGGFTAPHGPTNVHLSMPPAAAPLAPDPRAWQQYPQMMAMGAPYLHALPPHYPPAPPEGAALAAYPGYPSMPPMQAHTAHMRPAPQPYVRPHVTRALEQSWYTSTDPSMILIRCLIQTNCRVFASNGMRRSVTLFVV